MAKFKSGLQQLKDAARSGCPATTMTMIKKSAICSEKIPDLP